MNKGLVFSHSFYRNYIKVAAVCAASGGPFFLAALNSSWSHPAVFAVELLTMNTPDKTLATSSTTRFVSGLLGAVSFGWGATLWQLSSPKVYNACPDQVRKIVLTSLCTWFVADSMAALAVGYPSNALWNVGLLALAGGPLWWKLPPISNTDVASKN